MDEQTSVHGRLEDDEIKHELSGLLATGQQTRSEEWLQTEPSGEDQPEVDRSPNDSNAVGVPVGMDPVDVERRSETATYLGKEVWPADRDTLLAHAEGQHATDAVLADLRRLPGDREYVNLTDAWAALGHGVEAPRD